jgi:hypothetical protein
MKAYFTNVTDLAAFCAELARQGVTFDVTETSAAGRYQVTLVGA